MIHSSNFRDVPPIEVAVEGRSMVKHYRKKRRTMTFTLARREEQRRTLIKIPWPKRRQTQTSCTTNYSRPFSTYSPSSPFPLFFPRTHALVHAFASPPCQQTPKFPTILKSLKEISPTQPPTEPSPPITIAWIHVASSPSPL